MTSDEERIPFFDQPERSDLPREVDPEIRWSRVVATLATTLLILVIGNFAVNEFLQRNVISLVEAKWEMIETRGDFEGWLVIGDSTCHQGVDPQVWGEEFGPTLNLCTIANATVVDDAWMIETWERRNPRPRGILVVHAHDVWQRQFETKLLAEYPLEWGFWRNFEVGVEPTAREKFVILLLKYVPLYSRSGRLTTIERTWEDEETRQRRDRARAPSTFIREDGFMPWPSADPDNLRKDLDDMHRRVEDGYSLADSNRRAIEWLAEYSDRTGTPVVIAHSPLVEEVAQTETYRAYLGAMNETLGEIESAHPDVHLVDEVWEVDAERAELADHVTVDAARDYTAWLRSRVARELRTSAD